MYGWIWRKLPGKWPVKAIESIVMIALIGTVLVVLVFPWVEPKLPFSGNTVSGDTDGDATPSPSPTTKSPSPTDIPSPSTSDSGGDVIPGD